MRSWFKWYAGTATDIKFPEIAASCGAPLAYVIAIWAYILERAHENGGSIDALACTALDLHLGMPKGTTECILNQMIEAGLVTPDMRIKNWEKLQSAGKSGRSSSTSSTGPAKSSTERSRAYRERQKKATQCNGDATQCNAIDKNREEERRKEKREEREDATQRNGDATDATQCNDKTQNTAQPSQTASPSLSSDKRDANNTCTQTEKQSYGELGNVKLTHEEYEKLCERYGKNDADERIRQLDLYIASKGKKYKSHYATVLSWERMDEKRAANVTQDQKHFDMAYARESSQRVMQQTQEVHGVNW